tara:strand:- start:522 stop:881 length:360 start_codon:yes stop_codon:yes gene_type:complete
MVCLREAEKQRVGRPAYALWNTKKWQNKFRSQVTKAYQLLKKYSDKAIVNALNSYKGKNIYSLRVKFLEPIVQNEQKKLDKIDSREIKEVEYKDNTLSPNVKPFGKKGRLSRLKDLENE